ncbi:protein of unknown function [Mucilaginibacter pineti]|uniref:Uncharacterized protein n=1 Tax=Mucilaginibacter pineti TaxID=1391627 RepID=A0A1G6X512_9SPHI|nr:DUF4091 domain-containing protein [Mucilaginibacter pineti]SDD72346.1 protein of unknown function [Mucilaginibacter pineti]
MKTKFSSLFCLYLVGAALLAAPARVKAQSVSNETYAELPDPKPVDHSSWTALKPGTYISFADKGIRYAKNSAPQLAIVKNWAAKAWKGDKVQTEFLMWTTAPVKKLNFEYAPLQDGKGHTITANNIKANFVRYVITDELSGGSGCGIPKGLDSSLVADVIDNQTSIAVSANTVQPVWLSVVLPREAIAGSYNGTIKVKDGSNTIGELKYKVSVLNRALPQVKDWKFRLDLWQNPYSVARVYGVKPWSAKHMEIMKPYMQMLANGGQKTITATIIADPWNGQTYDIYDSMIKWTKKKNGSWTYDYTNFDKWVSYMSALGINKLINCYSMIPWNLKFYYDDELTGKTTFITAEPGSAEYAAHWKPMLANFAKHLKQKGWFGKTTIAMDERPMEAMQKAIAVIKSADKDFKISLAGNYHPQIQKDIFDYCIASGQVITDEVLQARKAGGLNTTYYTCCTEAYPNTFTFSPPAESAWLGLYAANKGFDGYLRWAYNCWSKNPLQDTRFGSWSAGDAFLVYPRLRSSVRYELLIAGIRDYEKIQVLRNEFQRKNQTDKLDQLNKLLKDFEIDRLKTGNAKEMVTHAEQVLNAF